MTININTTDSSDSDEQVYIVEKIAGYKYAKGAHEFLVKWNGYEGRDTWEPVKKLNCPSKVNEYFAEHNFEKKCKNIETQTIPILDEDESSSILDIFRKGQPKMIMDTKKGVLPEALAPVTIESINIEERTAIITHIEEKRKVSIDWLTENYPSFVNQFFLDKKIA